MQPLKKKLDAIRMRLKGASLIEISKKLNIAKSSASLWVRNVVLPTLALEKIQKTELNGREKGLAIMKEKRAMALRKIMENAQYQIKRYRPHKQKYILGIIAAMLFWCEGNKRRSAGVQFSNSDPKLIRVFLHAFRSYFEIDESKFRALIHIHEYHNDLKQKKFWSRVTDIPLSQFTKSYLKPHTGINKRKGYPGCISIRYGKASIAKMLHALYHTFAEQIAIKGA